jgi:HlyD family secretion protein
MDETRKRWIWLVLGGAVLVALLVGLAGRDPVPSVSAARATRENLDAWISSDGKVEPVQPYSLRAQLGTFVNRVLANEGQAVRKGQLLVELDATGTSAQLAQARQNLIAAQEDLRAARTGGRPEETAKLESDLRKAQAELERLRQQQAALERLVASHAATQDELAENQLALERAEADWRYLQQKKDELARRAGLDLDRATLRVQQMQDEVRDLEQKVHSAQVSAPADGTLYSLPVRPGDYVHVGDLVAEMADLHRVRVRAFVDEPDLGSLALNQPVEIAWDAMPNKVWTGTTEQVPRQVVARGARSVGEVLCSVANERLELLPNVNVSVHIRVRQRSGALVVPRAAVRAEGSRRYVFVIDAGRLRRREVQVGIASATKYEVLQGLAEGDLVGLPGDVELRDGLEVRAVEIR